MLVKRKRVVVGFAGGIMIVSVSIMIVGQVAVTMSVRMGAARVVVNVIVATRKSGTLPKMQHLTADPLEDVHREECKCEDLSGKAHSASHIFSFG